LDQHHIRVHHGSGAQPQADGLAELEAIARAGLQQGRLHNVKTDASTEVGVRLEAGGHDEFEQTAVCELGINTRK
jgi:hypothetical protein